MALELVTVILLEHVSPEKLVKVQGNHVRYGRRISLREIPGDEVGYTLNPACDELSKYVFLAKQRTRLVHQ